jgi:hypothetical protein
LILAAERAEKKWEEAESFVRLAKQAHKRAEEALKAREDELEVAKAKSAEINRRAVLSSCLNSNPHAASINSPSLPFAGMVVSTPMAPARDTSSTEDTEQSSTDSPLSESPSSSENTPLEIDDDSDDDNCV